MTLFVDASAVVGIVAPEGDAAMLAGRMDADDDLIWSPIARWEAVVALCRSYNYDLAVARATIDSLAQTKQLRTVDIGTRETELALDAYGRYGKNRDPAGLNMGDCFAYACAKANSARLLYKGDDFAKTDMA